MAATANARNLMLESDSPRTLSVELPSDYTTTGDHSGTLTGSAQINFQNSQITLSSNGTLQNAGGGQVTDGTSIGNLNASNITTGTLSAARIGAGSITASKIASNTITSNELAANSVTATEINVSTLSAIAANLGTVTAGDITGTADIDISGKGVFNGSSDEGFGGAAVNANISLGSTYGVIGRSSANAGVYGYSGSGEGVLGQATSAGGVGGSFTGSAGATALQAFGDILLQGNITMQTQTISNLTVGTATTASLATNATNATLLNGYAATSYTRYMVTDSGTATASSAGIVLQVTVTGVRSRATGGRNVVIESFSDENLKFDINPETLGLNFLMKLKPITYQVKANPGITYHGLGARATEKILKRKYDSLCMTHDDGVKGIDYMGMIGVLIKAVQELSEKVNKLENKLSK